MTLAAAAVLMASGISLADPPKFATADANGDGGVDATEFAATKRPEWSRGRNYARRV